MPRRSATSFDKNTMEKVIKLLEQEKPITKKAACEMLNITYNTARLKKLIEEFKEKEANAKKRRAKLRGKPLSDGELAIIAQEYLNGESITAIADFIYRSTAIVKKAVQELNIPLRTGDASYQKPYFIEDDAIADDYVKDDLVYSARYQTPAVIDKVYTDSKEGPYYRIWLLGDSQQFAVQPYWELADLRRIQKDLNVKIASAEGLPATNSPTVRKT